MFLCCGTQEHILATKPGCILWPQLDSIPAVSPCMKDTKMPRTRGVTQFISHNSKDSGMQLRPNLHHWTITPVSCTLEEKW